MPTGPRRRRARSTALEQTFRAIVAELGGEVLEPEWLGSNRPHRIHCKAGHESTPIPTNIVAKRGICRICADMERNAAGRHRFVVRLAEHGAVMLDDVYHGAHHPHRIRCPKGHETTCTPHVLQRGGYVCKICSRRDPETSERNFRTAMFEIGAEVLEGRWRGTQMPHRVRDAAGHIVYPRPANVSQGWGICKVCASKDPADAERRFRERVTELGAEVLEPVWLGALTPHRVRCKEGHVVSPRPAGVMSGQGLCRVCAGSEWDVFYVVADTLGRLVKFGVTSGDPAPRLADHARAGLTEKLRILPGGLCRTPSPRSLTVS